MSHKERGHVRRRGSGGDFFVVGGWRLERWGADSVPLAPTPGG